MPPGYKIVDVRTVRGPDGREHDVLDAITALEWREQLCPLMRHEYTRWGQGPKWAWNVISEMLLVRSGRSFAAYFRGYTDVNHYWDAPDGLRYWHGNLEIDRGQPDDAALRRVKEGAKPKEWHPRHAPNGIGLYERDETGWRPTEAALATGYLPCRSCERKDRKTAIVISPKDSHSAPAFIAAAQDENQTKHGRPLTREELTHVLKRYAELHLEDGW